MIKQLLFLGVLILSFSAASQNKVLLPGQVLYLNTAAPGVQVVNINSQEITITDQDGTFTVEVAVGDELVFNALNYEMERVIISEEILKNKRLIVEVNEKVTELDEVIVTPEDQQAFLKVQEDRFKEFSYEQDHSTQVENVALSPSLRGMQNGINFVNIFKAIFGNSKKNKVDSITQKKDKLPDLLVSSMEREFFIYDLKIPENQLDAFLYYCGDNITDISLLKKENEFLLIDFLVIQSINFLKQ